MRHEIVAELPVSFGSGLVEVGPLPDDGAYAFPQGELPVEGPNIYLRRDRP